MRRSRLNGNGEWSPLRKTKSRVSILTPEDITPEPVVEIKETSIPNSQILSIESQQQEEEEDDLSFYYKKPKKKKKLSDQKV